MKYLIVFLGVIFCAHIANSARILYISLTPSPSHHIWDKTLAMNLKSRGHEIIFVTHSDIKDEANFTAFVFEGIYDILHSTYDYASFSEETNLENIQQLFNWIGSLVDWDMKTEGFKKFINFVNKKPKIDLIIMDVTAGLYMYPIIEKLGNPPCIGTSAFGVQPYHTYYFGIDLQPSYFPIYFMTTTDEMSFFERAENYFYYAVFLFYREYIYMPKVWSKVEAKFGKNVKPYKEYEKHFSLLLANYDPVLDYPLSLPPAIISVGGLHTKREKDLPKDLKQILDNAKDGFILFSLGTNFLSKDLKEDQKQALIEGLGRMKQTIIWKYEEKISGLPKNFVTREWVPQNDILAHPNIKAFLTHGGGLSTQEAIYHGVPVISMPFFADQYVNTKKMVVRKLGQSIKYNFLTPDDVYNTVSEVVNNPIYFKNAKIISKRHRDQPEDPLTRAVWWVEYSIRQNGAQHLRVASRDLSFIQTNMLDVWAVLVATTLITYYLLKKTCCMLFGSKKTVDIKKKIK